MITTSTRPERRRTVIELRKQHQRPNRLERPKALPAKRDRSIYTGDVLQEIARQQAAGNREFSGRTFALKARSWSFRKMFGKLLSDG